MALPSAFDKSYFEAMVPLEDAVAEFTRLLSAGQTLRAIEQYYDEGVVVFENRTLARAGKKQCLEFERTQLAAQPQLPTFKLRAHAVNAKSEQVFLEYTVRFADPEGRPLRLEQVAVQQWSRSKIVEERFYYEGVVDEGDTTEASE